VAHAAPLRESLSEHKRGKLGHECCSSGKAPPDGGFLVSDGLVGGTWQELRSSEDPGCAALAADACGAVCVPRPASGAGCDDVCLRSAYHCYSALNIRASACPHSRVEAHAARRPLFVDCSALTHLSAAKLAPLVASDALPASHPCDEIDGHGGDPHPLRAMLDARGHCWARQRQERVDRPALPLLRDHRR
jgi:hypothetical protein